MEWGHILCRYLSNWSGNCVLKFVCREAWCQASLQQAGVCVMCADTSRMRHKVCTHLEDPCVWVLRVGVALESKVDAACVRTAKEEGPTRIFPYVVREGTRQRKDVPYVGKYWSGTGRVAPNLAIKGRGPVPRKWWSGRRGIGGPRKCTNWTSGSQSFW